MPNVGVTLAEHMNALNEDPQTEPRGFVQTALLMIVFVGCLADMVLGRLWRKVVGK